MLSLPFHLRIKIQIWLILLMILGVNVMPAQYVEQLLEPSPNSVLASPCSWNLEVPTDLLAPTSCNCEVENCVISYVTWQLREMTARSKQVI